MLINGTPEELMLWHRYYNAPSSPDRAEHLPQRTLILRNMLQDVEGANYIKLRIEGNLLSAHLRQRNAGKTRLRKAEPLKKHLTSGTH